MMDATDPQTSFEELVDQYPDLERTLAPQLRTLPWVKLFAYRALPRRAYGEIEAQLSEQGLSAGSPQYQARRRQLFIEEIERHRQAVRDSVADSDIQEIADWFIQRDAANPELVREQIDYWHRPESEKLYADGKLVVDVHKIDFWNISDSFYLEKSGEVPEAILPSFLVSEVKKKIVQHYLKLALAGGLK